MTGRPHIRIDHVELIDCTGRSWVRHRLRMSAEAEKEAAVAQKSTKEGESSEEEGQIVDDDDEEDQQPVDTR